MGDPHEKPDLVVSMSPEVVQKYEGHDETKIQLAKVDVWGRHQTQWRVRKRARAPPDN